MIIEIDPDLRIKGESRAWELQKLRGARKNGKPEWRTKSYFNRFHLALRAAFNEEVRVHPAVGVDQALTAIDEIHGKYAKLFDRKLGEPDEND